MSSCKPLSLLRMILLGIILASAGGCQTKAGVIFPTLAKAPVWPPPPDQARISYVGQLLTDQDLKPAVNGFDALGQALFGKKEAHSMLSPLAVCTDRQDRLFVADSNAQLVHVFDCKTRQYARWTPGKGFPMMAQPVAVAWDAIQHRLLVSDSVAAAVLMFDDKGKYLGHLGGDEADKLLQRPVGVVVDHTQAHQGRVLVADAKLHQIVVFSADGRLEKCVGGRGEGPGQFNYPTYLAMDPSGLVYVSDSLNFRVQQFDADLKFLRQIGKKGDYPGYFAQPKGIATDAEGHLYVVDAQFENIQVYDKDGQVLMDLGQEGTGAGEFWLPVGIYIETSGSTVGGGVSRDGAKPAVNRIYVADSYNRRVEVFDYLGVPEDVP